MITKITVGARNNGDGSVGVKLFPNKAAALSWLNRTEEEIENGSPYDDGIIEEKELEFDDNGNLLKEIYMDLDGIG